MGLNFFTYNGKCSRDFGIYISGENTFNAPERDVESIEVPGRNGNLIISRNRFKNISVSYPFFIRRDFQKNVRGARAWLLSSDQYAKLEDTYDPEFYRMARFSGPLDFDMRFLNYSGEATLTFDCKPQRWRKNGERTLLFNKKTTLYNDLFPALPLIKINGTGAGNLYVGEYTVKILELEDYIMLDSDLQDAYRDTQNKNNTIATEAFPVLKPGESTISWDGGIESVEITPRWWTI